MANFQGLKTINLEETKDPLRNLWRNVLIIGIEDLFKKKEIQYATHNKKYCVEEMWLHHEDFNLVCEYSQLSPKIVKNKIIKALKVMEKKYVNQKNLSPMSGKWFYKTNELNRKSDGSYTPMSAV
jgi:flagellar biosynthesis regulator FlbT